MSNQKTPKNKRHFRRSDANPRRGLFIEDENPKESSKFTDIISKVTGVLKKEVPEEPVSEGRRKSYKESRQMREGTSRNDFRPIHVFEKDDRGESEKRLRRNRHTRRTFIFFGASAAVFVTAIIVSIVLFSDKEDKTNEAAFNNENVLAESTAVKNRVVVHYDNKSLEIFTEAKTVGEVLSENEIQLLGEQKASHNEGDTVIDGMEIFITDPMTVSVVHNEIVNSVTMYGGRVSDVFEMMEIELDENDIVIPAADTLLEDNLSIEFIDVEIIEVREVEDLPYETEEGETDTVESGYYHEEQEGKKGTVQITYEVKTVNGVEESRIEISREVIDEPTNRVILWGTATPSNKSSNDSGDSGDSSDNDGNGYSDITVKNPGEQATNPSIPAAPSDYIEIMSGHVTAYTHTGNTTATGTWPRSTRTLDNPGSCAVVPSTIPYGSLLYVTGYGYCIAEDTGAFRTNPDRWNQIDLFMNTRDECITWGRRYKIKVYILRKGY